MTEITKIQLKLFGAYLLILLVLILSSGKAFGQTLHLQDQQTLQPIPFANIVTKQLLISEGDNTTHKDYIRKGTTTDINGQADLSQFPDDILLEISFIGYETRKITKNEMAKKDYVILLAQSSQYLDDVVISASKFREKRENVAYQIQSLDVKQIQNANASTTADLLTVNQGITIQKSQLGGGSPIIRGFEANRVLLVVDGVRMNNAIYRSGHLQNALTVDANALEIVEVVFGPSSTIYGSDALGGVVHFYTKKPVFSKNDKTFIKSNVEVRYGTAANEHSIHFDNNIGWDNVANFFSVTVRQYGDLKMGEWRPHGYNDWGLITHYVDNDVMVENDNPNIQVGTGYQQIDILNNTAWRVNEEMFVRFNNQFSTTSDIPRYDNLQEYKDDNLKWSEWSYGPQTRFMSSLDINSYKTNRFFDGNTLTMAYQFIEEDRITRKFQYDDYNNTYIDVHVASLNWDFTLNKLVYGLELTNNNVLSTATEGTQTRYPSGGSNLSTAALYGSYKKEVNEHFVWNAGFRYSQVFGDMSFNNTDPVFVTDKIEFNNGALTGNVNLIYKPGNDWKFDWVASSGFRNPNIDDYGKVFVKKGNMVIPNPDLTPEYAYNGEMSITKKWEKIQVTSNVYYTHLKDAIVKQDLGYSQIHEYEEVNVQSLMNSPEAYIYGWSFGTKTKLLSWLSTENSFSWQTGWDVTNDEPLGHIPPAFGKSLFKMKNGKLEYKLWGIYTMFKGIEDMNSSGVDNNDLGTEDGYPSWWTLNTSVQYKFNKKIKLQLGIENILDQHYRTFASGISAPGRNVIISLKTNF
jgi:hemoglobin/transferrin/lactoferrin receptor protein